MSKFSWQKTWERRNDAVKVKNSFLILYGLKKKEGTIILFFERVRWSLESFFVYPALVFLFRRLLRRTLAL